MFFIAVCMLCFFFKQKTAYEMRISDWSSDVCSSDLHRLPPARLGDAEGCSLSHRQDREHDSGAGRCLQLLRCRLLARWNVDLYRRVAAALRAAADRLPDGSAAADLPARLAAGMGADRSHHSADVPDAGDGARLRPGVDRRPRRGVLEAGRV